MPQEDSEGDALDEERLHRALVRLQEDWLADNPRDPNDLELRIRNAVVRVLLGTNWEGLIKAAGLRVSKSTIRRNDLLPVHQDAIVAVVNDRLRPAAPITPGLFIQWKPAVGGSAVLAFAAWLRENRRPPRVFYGDLPPPAEAEPESPARLRGVIGFLKRADLRTVKVVHQAGMTDGLRALASHLIHREIPNDPELRWRDVCYLPVTRDHKTQARITLPRLVRDLYAFFHPEEGAPPLPVDAESLRKALQAIRVKMAERPALLILEGHHVVGGALPELRALVADDPLTALLRELLHPLLDIQGSPPDATVFCRNRFLILADQDLPRLGPFADDHLKLLPLPVGRLPEVLRSQGLAHFERLTEIFVNSDRMKSDSELALADVVLTLRKRRLGQGVEPAILIRGLTSASFTYEALVTELRHTRRWHALFALRLAALTDGGLRHVTFARIVDQWRKLQPVGMGADFDLPPLSVDEVAAQLDVLAPILAQGPDEPVAGLDDMVEPYVFLDEEEAPSGVSQSGQEHAFDLRSPQLRDVILEQLVSDPRSHAATLLMHRLLAEEALRQQTHAVRHAEWRGSADARYYRRLVQMIFHGFASLPPDTNVWAPETLSAPTVLPANPRIAYRRLYAVFFRTLLEHPPHYDLSRTLGRDALKAELLLWAMNAGRPVEAVWPSWRKVADLQPMRSVFLDLKTAAQRDIDLPIALEQLISLARAAFQANNLGMAARARDEARDLLLDAQASGAGIDLDPYRRQFAKISLDIAAFLAPLDQKDSLENRLRAEGFNDTVFQGLMDLVGCTAGVTSPDAADEQLYRTTNAFLTTHCVGKSADDLANWSDLLSRLGEVDAMIADDPLQTDDRDAARFRAFAIFYLAERMRREAFNREPLGRSYVVNGHSTRVLVRLSLQLVRALGRAGSAGIPGLPSWRYFVMFARRHLDLLTRYSARYNSERPSILCLEATFTRSVGGLQREKLLSALSLLHEADLLMFSTPDRRRVRWRMLLERAKVLRALASISTEAERLAWWRLAALDVVRLWRLVTAGERVARPTSIWQRAVAGQAASLRALLPDPISAGLDTRDWDELQAIPTALPEDRTA